MGNNPTKSQSAPPTPIKSVASKSGIVNHKNVEATPPPPSPTNLPDPVLDPRSPNIERTPMTNVLSRFNSRNIENAVTPKNLLRNKLLREFGNKYSEKEINLLDPRSPTVNVPRTPIHFSMSDGNETDISTVSEPFCTLDESECIEASCRAFNEKISNITLDDSDYEDGNFNASDELECIRQKYMETHFDVGDGDGEKLSEDPRSPSTNVFRTPIILSTGSKVTTVDELVDELDSIDKEMDKCINIEDIKDGDIELIETNLPISSSTPTVPSDSSAVKVNNLEKLIKNKIYEDAGHELVIQNDGNAIIMTPVRKFIKKEATAAAVAAKPRTPLGVLNRRTKSAESLSKKQSRIQQNVAENKAMAFNSKSNKNPEVDENFTPKCTNAMNKNETSNKRSLSRIPIFKKIN